MLLATCTIALKVYKRLLARMTTILSFFLRAMLQDSIPLLQGIRFTHRHLFLRRNPQIGWKPIVFFPHRANDTLRGKLHETDFAKCNQAG